MFTLLCRRASAVITARVLITTQAAMARAKDGSAAAIAEELGPIEFKRFHRSLEEVDKLVFIRHGEKLDEEEYGKTSGLTAAGQFRAGNLVKVFGDHAGALLTPDVIYAMRQGKHTDNSNRPYLTVEPLAEDLGMKPVMDEQNAAGTFNNTFHDREKLVKDVVGRAKDGDFENKTLLFCWEHKNIPYIVALLGLHDKELFWGDVPGSEADERSNYSAIWVFTPSKSTLQVFKQFEVEPDPGATNASGTAAFTLVAPQGGYTAVVRTMKLDPVQNGD